MILDIDHLLLGIGAQHFQAAFQGRDGHVPFLGIMVIILAGLVVGKVVRVHVIHHFPGHQGTVLGVFFCPVLGLFVTVLVRIGLALLAGFNAGLGIGLGLPGLVEQPGNELLFILHFGDGIHLVHGLALGGRGQFQLQLGEHELQAHGGPQLTRSNGGRRRKIDLAHQ